MSRTRTVTTALCAFLVALLLTAAGQADNSGRGKSDDRVERAGLASAPRASFPAGVPTQAGDPTRTGDRRWQEKDARDRADRKARKGKKDCGCWDQYAQGDIELKVLLVGADGSEPAFGDWQDLLTREGVPFTAIVARDAGPLTAATFSDRPGHALYQAVVLTNDSLLFWNGSAYVSALAPESWAALQAFETQFRVRQVTSVVYPQPQYGLEYPTFAGDFGGETAQLTGAGRAVFPYLTGTVLYDGGSFGYKARPLADAGFQTLVAAADGSALVGVNTTVDGRQELVSTVAQNQWLTQSRLLQHGILNWVTRGVHLGVNRNYLAVHVDDAFLVDDRWDTAANATSPDPAKAILMTPADVARAVAWQKASGVRLDLAFNGGGAAERPELAAALIGAKRSFGWINHTFEHPNLDPLDQATIAGEIRRNIQFALQHGLPFDRSELVTGIGFLAADASREAAQRQLGPALTVPRHPTNVFYNVGTKAEQLDEYNYLYYEACVSGCLSAPATWEQYVASEATIMFRHATANDPLPHYAHVSNLAEDGVLYPVVDAFLAKYRSLFATPLADPTLTESGKELRRAAQWQQAVAAGRASALLSGNKVRVQAPAGIAVPLTGTRAGDQYGGERSGWRTADGDFTVKLASAAGGDTD